jgi:hypothetical protein
MDLAFRISGAGVRRDRAHSTAEIRRDTNNRRAPTPGLVKRMWRGSNIERNVAFGMTLISTWSIRESLLRGRRERLLSLHISRHIAFYDYL